MSIQANFPALKPTLLLDFANVKALDPRITFVRSTSARAYDGVTVAMAEQNLLLRSQDYSATWTVTNLTPVTSKTAPDSTSTATEFTATAANAVLTQGYTAIAGSYTFSVWLRRVTGTGDIQIAADNGTWTTKTITGTWARYDVTQTVAAGSKTAGVRVVTDTDAIEVWGAQLEQRAAMTAYTVTTTQPITNYIPVLRTYAENVPRLDHNPVTEESLGLLIEEQRTNLLTYSQEFDNAAWGKTRSSITANTIVAPDGTLTGDKLVEDTTASNSHFIDRSFTFTAAAHTQSIYAKAGERSWIRLSFADGTTTFGAYFNLSAGTVGTLTANTTASIQSVGNGWYRCALTATAAAGTGTVRVWLASADNTNSYTGDGYSGIYIWGAQLEAGAFSTSYIPTVAAQVTRSADAASMTGTNFSSWYRQDEGTLYVEAVSGNATNDSGRLASINDNTSNNRIEVLYSTATQIQAILSANNITQASLTETVTKQNANKAAFAYRVNDTNASINASVEITDTACDIPVVSQLNIGARNGNSNPINGAIKKLAYYPVRCTNAQLQALTS